MESFHERQEIILVRLWFGVIRCQEFPNWEIRTVLLWIIKIRNVYFFLIFIPRSPFTRGPF